MVLPLDTRDTGEIEVYPVCILTPLLADVNISDDVSNG